MLPFQQNMAVGAIIGRWLTDTNRAARTLYERCGFKATGERQPLPSDPARSEIEMMLPL
jgi:hypothetical protein